MSKSKLNTSNYVTIIGKGTLLKGNLECAGSVRVDGSVSGDIKVTGNLLVGAEGDITGNIEAQSVNLAGTITGNIINCECLKMQSRSHLYGDIGVRNFIVDEGAVFRGKCEMIEDSPNDKKKHLKRDEKKTSVETMV